MKVRTLLRYFTKTEWILWGASAAGILIAFFLFDRESVLTLAASLIGVTSLIFNAKGHPVGQALMVVFSILYGIISFSFRYYGEMITYLGMTMPMTVIALAAWLRHPYQGKRSEVQVNRVKGKEWLLLSVLTVCVTAGFWFVLKYFHTANLIPSTVSVATSFAAAYLTFRRSPWFAAAYASNDLVLIVLWILASTQNPRYVSVTVCFAAFFFNDIYGFISWQRMKKSQKLREQGDVLPFT